MAGPRERQWTRTANGETKLGSTSVRPAFSVIATGLVLGLILTPRVSFNQVRIEATNAAKLQTIEYFLLPRSEGGSGALQIQPFAGQGSIITPSFLSGSRPSADDAAEYFGRRAVPGTPAVVIDEDHLELGDAIVPTRVLGSGGVVVEILGPGGEIVRSEVPSGYLPRREATGSGPRMNSILLGLFASGGFSHSRPYYAAFSDERGIVLAYFGNSDFAKLRLPEEIETETGFNAGILVDLAIVAGGLALVLTGYRRRKSAT